jgi:multidrug efflux pump subunit AcrB
MAYYYDIWFLFLLFLLILLIVLILLPKYTKKDLVPPLSDANYNIRTPTPAAIFSTTNSNATTFEDLVFEDGTSSGTSAIDFGGDAIDSSTISYVPYYSEAHKRLIGYFDLNIGTSVTNTLAFRAVDKNSAGGNTLASYNRGWTTLNTPDMRQSYSNTPIYNVKVPFNIPGNNNDIHKLTVQISRTNNSLNELELSSSYLYYFSV